MGAKKKEKNTQKYVKQLLNKNTLILLEFLILVTFVILIKFVTFMTFSPAKYSLLYLIFLIYKAVLVFLKCGLQNYTSFRPHKT